MQKVGFVKTFLHFRRELGCKKIQADLFLRRSDTVDLQMRKGIELLFYENIAAWFDQPDIADGEAIKFHIRAHVQKSEHPIDGVLNMDGRLYAYFDHSGADVIPLNFCGPLLIVDTDIDKKEYWPH